MKNQVTVKQLKDQNFRVEVYHGRQYVPGEKTVLDTNNVENNFPVMSRRDMKIKEDKNDFVLSHKGGFTIVELTTPDGKTAKGKFNFGKTCSFNRRIGLTAAIGRALKQIS